MLFTSAILVKVFVLYVDANPYSIMHVLSHTHTHTHSLQSPLELTVLSIHYVTVSSLPLSSVSRAVGFLAIVKMNFFSFEWLKGYKADLLYYHSFLLYLYLYIDVFLYIYFLIESIWTSLMQMVPHQSLEMPF